ncbi:hypothetical protein MLD38_009654 [Melastoma candidum]|uniref:Uncharacterized protein n=1 Tax=Melastoma candidum TaxID=119954 RepID=A0ACB9RYE4_9MYRT|nr:hypothetical protein MLD38_009654 [Melastoma candidum]
MESILTEHSSNSFGELMFGPRSVSIPRNLDFVNGFNQENGFGDPRSDAETASGSGVNLHEVEFPEENDTSNSIFKYINEILVEEDLEEKNCMLLDCLAKLQEEEKSWYDVLNQKSPPPPPVDSVSESEGNFSPEGNSSDGSNSFPNVERARFGVDGFHDLGDFDYFVPVDDSLCLVVNDSEASGGVQLNGHVSGNRGISHRTVEGEGNLNASLSVADEAISEIVSGLEIQHSQSIARQKKSHGREEDDVLQGERSSKQSAVFIRDESEPSELFDEVLLCPGEPFCSLDNPGAASRFQQSGHSKRSSNGKTTRKKKRDGKGDMVDLWTLLTQCAQSVASNDHRSSNELLKQIRQHSSSYGDGTQRLAHYFANGLEARLARTETPSYSPLGGVSAAQMLKSYQVYVQACPFKRMSNVLANRTIMKTAANARKLHIIDFGILYGFQWPCLIQRISRRPGGPPKLRITGIEFPQPGFKPSERVEETGRRLENYCKRFHVEFKYHVIARKWETIQLEDLRLEEDEMTVVNCLYRFKNLADETVVMNSPREAVLKLVRRINPDLFVHGVVNGTYNAPFFVTRFKEALFHFSSLYDMFDVNVDKEDQQRMLFEREVFGRDAMNVIACEGFARVERPETYKQWQARNMRAGFRQIPLDKDIFSRVKNIVRAEYHGDFIIDQVGHWMLQGWKGRVIYALSCWVPA